MTQHDVANALSRRAALGLGSVLALTGMAPVRAHSAGTDGFARVDALAASWIDRRIAPGLQLSVARDGRILFERGYGTANLETGTRVDARSVFKIGSVTKQFTAAAILLLQEDGRLSIDDPLARFFPDFPRAATITLRQMLTHTSGLGNYTKVDGRHALLNMLRLDYDDAELYRLMTAGEPLFVGEPGAQWAYSNTAYVLLGLIVGKVTGAPYQAFFRRRLFAPAAMTATDVDDAAAIVPGRVAGYSPGTAGRPFDNASFISMTVPGGAGNIRSTTSDLCRWHAALLGGTILKPASLDAMLTPVRLKSGALPEEDAPAPGTARKPVLYGMGQSLVTIEGRDGVEHGGGINGFVSNLSTLRRERVTVAIITNVDGGQALYPALDALKVAATRAGLAAAGKRPA